MARNFREKNKFLYDVQHESASYFMDRMIKLLDEEDGFTVNAAQPNFGTQFPVDKNVFKGILGNSSLNAFADNPEKLTITRMRPAAGDMTSMIVLTPGSEHGVEILVPNKYVEGTLNLIDPGSSLTMGYGQSGVGITHSTTQQGLYNPEDQPWYTKVTEWIKDNPGTAASYGALAAAGLVGAYYLYKKWQEKGSVDENDKAIAAKLDAENEK